jgi:hypothetical protein
MVKRLHILLVVVLASVALVPASSVSAHAETAVQRALRQRREIVATTRTFRVTLDHRQRGARARIASAERFLAAWPRLPLDISTRMWPKVHALVQHDATLARRDLSALRRWERRRIARLHREYGWLNDWLDTVGIFRACPVPALGSIANNFGVIVRLPHVPVHVHQGNDIAAPTWSPIVAPFDGYAWSSSSQLGGLNVSVRGDRGYVFNAHLSALGNLGYVHAGEVIGYVGATGDATGPHDHFEWHPWGGAAADPYPFLVAACVQSP